MLKETTSVRKKKRAYVAGEAREAGDVASWNAMSTVHAHQLMPDRVTRQTYISASR